MPPLRNGRASKACTACRKQKTRCYESASSTGSCLRCETLGQPCSLKERRASGADRSATSGSDQRAQLETNERLDRLESTIASLVQRLDANDPHASVPMSTRSLQNKPRLTARVDDQSVAPVMVIRDIAKEVGVRSQDKTDSATLEPAAKIDIVSKGYLTYEEASSLLSLFCEHYGRWVSFTEHVSIDALMDNVRKSPLLLCACSIIAVRHTTQELATRLASRLFEEAKSLISISLLETPQPMQFFQAALLLSLWSTTIGQVPLSLDGWLLSGFALQHSRASNVFASSSEDSLETSATSMQSKRLHKLALWNHLCLAHLHYCVGTRRKAVLDDSDIERSRSILHFDNVTNFELRMVAEIHLYWILYEVSSAASIDLANAQTRLRKWQDEWAFLFGSCSMTTASRDPTNEYQAQPRSQFLQMGHHFAHLVIFDLSLKSRSTAVKESLLTEMARVSSAIIKIAMETSDDRTRHLTDHIYHMITFAAVTLCRLLHMYESQLGAQNNASDLDDLILQLVRWLHSIGLPCHIAHTLGDVVSAFHRKLRPDAHFAATPETGLDQTTPEDFSLFFPELLGMDSLAGSMEDLLPDWEPFIADITRR